MIDGETKEEQRENLTTTAMEPLYRSISLDKEKIIHYTFYLLSREVTGYTSIRTRSYPQPYQPRTRSTALSMETNLRVNASTDVSRVSRMEV